MNKRILSFLLVLVLALFVLPLTVLAGGSLSNFSKIYSYPKGQFSDVPATQWYADEVQLVYEYGLVNGTTPTTFSPEKNLTIAEAIKLAACLNNIYSTGTSSLKSGDPLWYQTYVDYALSNGIIQSPYPNYTAYATRSDMAVIFANALPDDALTPINAIDNDAIPDVSMNLPYSAAIYKLYNAGILTGIDDTHAYKPNDSISRAETAAIVTRMVNNSIRESFTISPNGLPSDTPKTTIFTITAEPSTVSVAKDAQATVNFSVNSTDFDMIVPVIGDTSIIACTWGIPSSSTIPLTIIGLSGGTTTISVRLLDASDTVLAEAVVNVTVTGSSVTTTGTFFPGYYPVPDYGVYVNTTPHYIDYDDINGSTLYAYRIADMTVDMDYAVDGYMRLLEQNGFKFNSSFNSINNDVIFVFINTAYHLKLYLTAATINNVPSIIVKVTPT